MTPRQRHAIIDDGSWVSVGNRVELHPACDAWMMGDRYGEVVKVGTAYLYVKCDRSGRVRKLHPLNVGRVIL